MRAGFHAVTVPTTMWARSPGSRPTSAQPNGSELNGIQPRDPAHAGIGLEPITPHECRYTAVSIMVASGADRATLIGWVGHADLKMLDHYTHRSRLGASKPCPTSTDI